MKMVLMGALIIMSNSYDIIKYIFFNYILLCNNIMLKDYPYLSKLEEMNEDILIKELKNYKTVIRKSKDNYIITLDYYKNKKINKIADYFTEPCRIKCKIENKESIYEYFNRNKKRILNINNMIEQRRILYKQPNCSNFNIFVALNVLCLIKPKSWVDISSGWGDRLVSCICYNKLQKHQANRCKYYGSDPNSELFKYYRKIINTLDKNNKDDYKLINNGFNEADFDIKIMGDIDLVFSSPPFFTFEIYSDCVQDSIINYKTIKDWIKYFLKPMLLKSYNLLKFGGYLILYIEDRPEYQYIDKMNNYTKKIGFIRKPSILYYYIDKPQIKRELFVYIKN